MRLLRKHGYLLRLASVKRLMLQIAADMGTASSDIATEPKDRGFHWIIAAPLSLWCLFWLVI